MAIFQSAEEYIQFSDTFYRLVVIELDNAESYVAEKNLSGLVVKMRKLISMVNCVGYFRGQEGGFADPRPEGVSAQQGKLYTQEGECENRLQALIDILCASDQADEYRESLKEYYLQQRTNRTA